MQPDDAPTRIIDRTDLLEALVTMALSRGTEGWDDESPSVRAEDVDAVVRAFGRPIDR